MDHQQRIILGVKVDQVTRQEAQESVRGFLQAEGRYTVFTPNPEMLVAAHKDTDFQAILNRGSLKICDGTGMAIVSSGVLQRIPGVDFMLDVCEIAMNENKSVYLLGSLDDQTVLMTRDALQKQFPNLRIVGCDKGIELKKHSIDELVNEIHTEEIQKQNDAMIDRIIGAAPDILFVAFGSSKQEWWIDAHLTELPSVKVAMGVGGAFDFISGRVPRAPRWLRQIGLEWLWRLVIQPWRWKRIWNATVLFPWLVIKERL